MRILDRYICREVIADSWLGLAVFTFVFFVPQLVRLMSLVVQHAATAKETALLLFSSARTHIHDPNVDACRRLDWTGAALCGQRNRCAQCQRSESSPPSLTYRRHRLCGYDIDVRHHPLAWPAVFANSHVTRRPPARFPGISSHPAACFRRTFPSHRTLRGGCCRVRHALARCLPGGFQFFHSLETHRGKKRHCSRRSTNGQAEPSPG